MKDIYKAIKELQKEEDDVVDHVVDNGDDDENQKEPINLEV